MPKAARHYDTHFGRVSIDPTIPQVGAGVSPINMADRVAADRHLSALQAAEAALRADLTAAEERQAAAPDDNAVFEEVDRLQQAHDAATAAYVDACEALAATPARTLSDLALRARHAAGDGGNALDRAIIRDLRVLDIEAAADPIVGIADEVARLYELADPQDASPHACDPDRERREALEEKLHTRINALEAAALSARPRSAGGALYQALLISTLANCDVTAEYAQLIVRGVAALAAWIEAETGASRRAIARGMYAVGSFETLDDVATARGEAA